MAARWTTTVGTMGAAALLCAGCGASQADLDTLSGEVSALKADVQTLRGELDVERQRTDALARDVVALEAAADESTPADTDRSAAIDGLWASEIAGGAGGRSFDLVCESGSATALSGGAGAVLDSVALVCQSVAPDATFGEPTKGGRAGGEGGGRWLASCPESHVIIGVVGNSGAVIDRIGTVCAPVVAGDDGPTVDLDAERFRSEGAGGKGGKLFELSCPDGQVVRGLTGRSGAVIDALGLLCGPL